MRFFVPMLSSALVLAGCASLVVPESSSSTGTTGTPASTSGGGGSSGGCDVLSPGAVPADTGNADGEGGSAPAGAPFVTDWATVLGADGVELADLAASGAGDVLVVGSFTTALDLGSGVALSDAGGGGFLAKLDAGGAALWAREVSPTTEHVFADAGGGGWIIDGGESASLSRFDASGALLWTQDFDAGSAARLVPSGDGGAFVTVAGAEQIVKIDAAGNTGWVSTFDSLFWSTSITGPDDLRSVAIVDLGAAPGGGVTVLVQASETSVTETSVCNGSAALLVGVGEEGGVTWKQPVAPVGNAVTLSTDALGNVLLQESLSPDQTADLGHGELYGGVGLSMFDPAGKPRWGKHFPGSVAALRPGFDAAGNVVIAGSFTGNVDFGGGLMEGAGPALRLFVLEVSPRGEWLASRLFAAVGPDAQSPYDDADRPEAMAVGPDGAVILAATYTGAIDLGTAPLPVAASPTVNPLLARIGH